MSELRDRRAQKKAQTRAHIRSTAHQLFADHGFDAVTIADIAREAEVAVQTVFNHFPTKEELFFDGRSPWVTGPADAVRSRAAGVDPLAALRDYLAALLRGRFGALAAAESRTYLRTIETSEALLARERELVHESERLLADALFEVWTVPRPTHDGLVPFDPATAATLTAATWLSAVRSLSVGQRTRVHQGACPKEVAENLGRLAERLFDAVIASLPLMEQRVGPVIVPPVDRLARAAS